ncbi:MAG: hypothetical protein GY719_05565 [bacterium]|nr:hypothetical protein [bacterium]
MHENTTKILTALGLALLVGACVSTERATLETPPTEPQAPEATTEAVVKAEASEPGGGAEQGDAEQGDAEQTAGSPEVAAAIERALAEGWQELRIVSECLTESGPAAVEVFGNGVAIWRTEAQFTLTHDQIRQQLEILRDGGFADLGEVFGGRTPAPPETIEEMKRRMLDRGESTGSSGQPSRIVCRVELELDGVYKRTAQLRRGEQSTTLRQLAEQILDLCREPAKLGITAADLGEGLAKAAAGELAPETMALLLHHKPTSGDGAEGFLLRLDGREASSRTFRQGEGYGDIHELELHDDDLTVLLQLLADQGLGELPINLYAEHYTDLTVEVLQHRLAVQARQFADMTPTQHGEKQTSFERIFGEIHELHRRVMAEGRPAA